MVDINTAQTGSLNCFAFYKASRTRRTRRGPQQASYDRRVEREGSLSNSRSTSRSTWRTSHCSDGQPKSSAFDRATDTFARA